MTGDDLLIAVVFIFCAAVCVHIGQFVVRAIRQKQKFRLFWLVPQLIGLLVTITFLLPNVTNILLSNHHFFWIANAMHWGWLLLAGGLLLEAFVYNIHHRDWQRNKWLSAAILLFLVGMNGQGWMSQQVLCGYSLNAILIMAGGFLFIFRVRSQGDVW